VRVDGRVARGAGEVLVLLIGDVLLRLGVALALGQAEVHDVHDVLVLGQPDEEVIGFDVPVEEVVRVCLLKPH
jgi:hypothetical protein